MGPMNKVVIVAEIGVMHGLNNMDCNSPSDLATASTEHPDMLVAETNTELQIRNHSPG